ncbi:hypothetical protein KAM472_33390 [Aeromonas caviae]|nr:hypothetical protein KAM462_17800 [Aeromonas caviae]GKR11580.1 hypothetical protein KAM465_31570 [Aeromonas caviae]GKR15846.1 hypothetical protein KAM466_31640 [Aeromonas caviae]GKR19929.1 hypothetical protein KAM467_29730 [Aeromonas caviae]GKR28213.1 hypothetical protein KAM469_26720 [Aeromonas caviae]
MPTLTHIHRRQADHPFPDAKSVARLSFPGGARRGAPGRQALPGGWIPAEDWEYAEASAIPDRHCWRTEIHDSADMLEHPFQLSR